MNEGDGKKELPVGQVGQESVSPLYDLMRTAKVFHIQGNIKAAHEIYSDLIERNPTNESIVVGYSLTASALFFQAILDDKLSPNSEQSLSNTFASAVMSCELAEAFPVNEAPFDFEILLSYAFLLHLGYFHYRDIAHSNLSLEKYEAALALKPHNFKANIGYAIALCASTENVETKPKKIDRFKNAVTAYCRSLVATNSSSQIKRATDVYDTIEQSRKKIREGKNEDPSKKIQMLKAVTNIYKQSLSTASSLEITPLQSASAWEGLADTLMDLNNLGVHSCNEISKELAMLIKKFPSRNEKWNTDGWKSTTIKQMATLFYKEAAELYKLTILAEIKNSATREKEEDEEVSYNNLALTINEAQKKAAIMGSYCDQISAEESPSKKRLRLLTASGIINHNEVTKKKLNKPLNVEKNSHISNEKINELPVTPAKQTQKKIRKVRFHNVLFSKIIEIHHPPRNVNEDVKNLLKHTLLTHLHASYTGDQMILLAKVFTNYERILSSKESKNDFEAHFGYATVLHDLGKFKEAIDAYSAAILLEQGRIDVLEEKEEKEVAQSEPYTCLRLAAGWHGLGETLESLMGKYPGNDQIDLPLPLLAILSLQEPDSSINEAVYKHAKKYYFSALYDNNQNLHFYTASWDKQREKAKYKLLFNYLDIGAIALCYDHVLKKLGEQNPQPFPIGREQPNNRYRNLSKLIYTISSGETKERVPNKLQVLRTKSSSFQRLMAVAAPEEWKSEWEKIEEADVRKKEKINKQLQQDSANSPLKAVNAASKVGMFRIPKSSAITQSSAVTTAPKSAVQKWTNLINS